MSEVHDTRDVSADIEFDFGSIYAGPGGRNEDLAPFGFEKVDNISVFGKVRLDLFVEHA
jgi:hypothetical protein